MFNLRSLMIRNPSFMPIYLRRRQMTNNPNQNIERSKLKLLEIRQQNYNLKLNQKSYQMKQKKSQKKLKLCLTRWNWWLAKQAKWSNKEQQIFKNNRSQRFKWRRGSNKVLTITFRLFNRRKKQWTRKRRKKNESLRRNLKRRLATANSCRGKIRMAN